MSATIIFALWFAGMGITIFLAATGYVRILLSLRYTEPAEDALAEPWRKLLTEHGIDPRTVPMLMSQNLGPALVRTPLGYRFVVPNELWSELSELGRQGILKHELAHFRRRDVWKSFFVRMLALPHWFNPVAHFAANRFDELAEQLCDREAFAGKRENISEFAQILLLLHENAPTHFVARHSIFGRNFGNNLRSRVASLLENPLPERTFTMRKILLVLGTAAILFAALFRFEFVATTTAHPFSGPQTPLSVVAAQEPGALAPGLQHLWTSVIDAETQKPLAGVKATLYFAKPGGVEVDTRTTQSDKQGQIRFPLPSELNADMEAGTDIRVTKEGYVSEQNGRQAKWTEIFLKEGKLMCETFQLQKAEAVSGRIVDEQGKPLAGVLVAVFRQKLKEFQLDGWRDLESYEFKTDADGRFRFDVAKDEKVVLWALPENLAPQYVFPDKKRGDLGNITVEKGFEPVVTVLDKDGNPVQDVWVNLARRGEYFNIQTMSAYARSALTDKDGRAKFRPVTEGDYEIRVSERPMERFYSPWSNDPAVSITWRAREGENKKPVKGAYATTSVKLSATLLTTIQAASTVTIDVQFSDKTTDSYRELNVNIFGNQGEGRHFAARPSSDSPSAYQGDGLFSFQVPIGLEKAVLRVPGDTNVAYRAKIDGESDWLEVDRIHDFPLGTIEKPMKIEVAIYKSPKIMLNVVDESGQPVKEYYAWMEYTKHGTPAKIKVDGDKIRVDITPERWNEITWEYARSEISLHGILDVSFTYKDFGKDETKVNAGGILPDEEMRLHIVGKGFALAEQMIPKMKEGEERELTLTLRKP